MSAQRNSQNGKMRAPEQFDQTTVAVTEDTPLKTTPKTVIAVIAGCIGAAILWSTLSVKVNADSSRMDKVEPLVEIAKEKIQVHSFHLEKIDTRVNSLEEWRKEMQAQREDIRIIRAMLEEQAKQKRP